jgi:hypothetical protein
MIIAQFQERQEGGTKNKRYFLVEGENERKMPFIVRKRLI